MEKQEWIPLTNYDQEDKKQIITMLKRFDNDTISIINQSIKIFSDIKKGSEDGLNFNQGIIFGFVAGIFASYLAGAIYQEIIIPASFEVKWAVNSFVFYLFVIFCVYFINRVKKSKKGITNIIKLEQLFNSIKMDIIKGKK